MGLHLRGEAELHGRVLDLLEVLDRVAGRRGFRVTHDVRIPGAAAAKTTPRRARPPADASTILDAAALSGQAFMPDSSRPSRRPQSFLFDERARRVRAPVVLAALLFATLLVSAYALRVELDQADRNEMNVARQGAAAANVLVTQGIASLQGARGLVDELGYVDPDGFDAFARPLIGAPGLMRVSPGACGQEGSARPLRARDREPDRRRVAVGQDGSGARAGRVLRRRAGDASLRRLDRGHRPPLGSRTRRQPPRKRLREGRTAVTGPIRLAGGDDGRLRRRCAALSALRVVGDAGAARARACGLRRRRRIGARGSHARSSRNSRPAPRSVSPTASRRWRARRARSRTPRRLRSLPAAGGGRSRSPSRAAST